MNYNNGSSDMRFFDSASEEELQERAKDYSEGNSDLELTLLNLWNHRIKTKGCCIGHNDNSKGYLSFMLNDKNSYKYLNEVFRLHQRLDVKDIEFMIDEECATMYYDRRIGSAVLYSLRRISEMDFSKKNEDPKELEFVKKIVDFCNRLGLRCNFIVLKDGVELAIYSRYVRLSRDTYDAPFSLTDSNSEIKFPFYAECSYSDLEQVFKILEEHQSLFEKFASIGRPIETHFVDWNFSDQSQFK